MLMIRQKIIKLIRKSIKNLQKRKKLPQFKIPEIQIEHPEKRIYGDYSINIAMVMAKKIKENPLKIAKFIISDFKFSISDFFEKVEVKEPGFINFFLSKKYLQKQIKELLKKGEKFGQLNIGKNKKINIEFISANPTGQLHLGHGRGAFFGDCLAKVLEKANYKIIRQYFINDAKVNTQIKLLGQTALGKGITYLNDYLKEKIKILEPKLQKCKNEKEAGFLLAQEIQKDTKNFIEEKLKIKFNQWISEESLYQKNKINKIFQWLKNKDLVYQKENAWWLKTSKFGDSQDWVIVKKNGEPTYLLSDIAYHKDKFKKGFQKNINIWGADHQAHVSKIKAAIKMLGYKGELIILISQVVRLEKGKISKRKGEIITLEDLIKEVGLDIARFLYLTKSLDSQMKFDLELAKEQSEKNPVYYIQYAYARINSILKKINSKLIQSKQVLNPKFQNFKLLTHPSELELIKELIRFPEIIEDTTKDYQVQRIPQYSLDLATTFHQFYRNCRVLTGIRLSRSKARLGLVLATKIVLKNILDLMEISAPEKM